MTRPTAPDGSPLPRKHVAHFLDTLAWAGVSLEECGGRVVGSGGCWTPLLQAEIDKRADPLRRLLAGGWMPPVSAPLPAAAAEPVSLDRITRMDHVMAAGERNARAKAEREEGYRAEALRRRFGGKAASADLFTEAQP